MPRLQVRRIAYALGAEVRGIDLRGPLDDVVIAEIRKAWLEHLVLCFPDQDLTKDQLLAFGGRFGELETSPKRMPGESPHIAYMTELEVNGRPWNGYKGGQNWHSDKSFTTTPISASFLNCKQIPAVGGDTMFANQHMAYDALSPAMQSLVGGLSAIHDHELTLSKSPSATDGRSAEEVERAAAQHRTSRAGGRAVPTVQPVVRIHPETGRKALYIGERVRKIEGMTDEESRPLLEFLNQHATRYEFTWRKRWTVNDLLMWDNRCTLHKALSDYVLQRDPRLMVKCAVLGTKSGRPSIAKDSSESATLSTKEAAAR